MLGDKLYKNDLTNIGITNNDNVKERFIVFFKRKIDLKYCQIVILSLITFLHFYYNSYDCSSSSINDSLYYHKISYFLSILLIIFGYILHKSNDSIYGDATIALGGIYIAYRHLFFSEYECHFNERATATFSRLLHNPPSFYVSLDFSSYFLILILSSVIPHVQFIQLKHLKFGQIRGDLRLNFISNEVLIPFGSTFVFLVIWKGIFMIGDLINLIINLLFN